MNKSIIKRSCQLQVHHMDLCKMVEEVLRCRHEGSPMRGLRVWQITNEGTEFQIWMENPNE